MASEPGNRGRLKRLFGAVTAVFFALSVPGPGVEAWAVSREAGPGKPINVVSRVGAIHRLVGGARAFFNVPVLSAPLGVVLPQDRSGFPGRELTMLRTADGWRPTMGPNGGADVESAYQEESLWDGSQKEPPSEGLPEADSEAYWQANKAEILRSLAPLREGLHSKAQEHQQRFGPAKLMEDIKKDLIHFQDDPDHPKIGRAEYNIVDHRLFVKIVHIPTAAAVLFLDQDGVSPASKHLRQIVSRIHVEAGRRRSDGKLGRNVALVWEKAGEVVSDRFLPRRPFLTREGLADWWHATAQRPTASNLFVAAVFGAGAQGLISYGLSALKVSLGLAHSIPMFPVYFTMAFGTILGVNIRTYMNWTQRGSPLAQGIKSSVVSCLFAFPIAVHANGWASLNPLTHVGFVTLAIVVGNIVFNNVGKVAAQQFFKIWRDNRMLTSVYWKFLKQDEVVNQSLYLVNWTFRLLDLLIGSWVVKGLYLAFIYVSRKAALGYAEKRRYPESADIQRRWRRDKARGLWIWLPALAAVLCLLGR